MRLCKSGSVHTAFWACLESPIRRFFAVLLSVLSALLRFLFCFLRLVSSLRYLLCCVVLPCKSGARLKENPFQKGFPATRYYEAAVALPADKAMGCDFSFAKLHTLKLQRSSGRKWKASLRPQAAAYFRRRSRSRFRRCRQSLLEASPNARQPHSRATSGCCCWVFETHTCRGGFPQRLQSTEFHQVRTMGISFT